VARMDRTEELLPVLESVGNVLAYIEEWCHPGYDEIIENSIRPMVWEELLKVEQTLGHKCHP
jgi:hypothetical protein